MPDKKRYYTDEPAPPNLIEWVQLAKNHFGRFAFDIGGVILFAFALMTLLALFNLTGGLLLTPWSLILWRLSLIHISEPTRPY